MAGQDDHRLGEHLQTDGTDELLLQALHDEERLTEEELEENREEEEEEVEVWSSGVLESQNLNKMRRQRRSGGRVETSVCF